MFILRMLVCLLFGLAACSREAPPPKDTAPALDPGELVVVSTNDFHAALDKAEGLASVIRDLRKRFGDQMVYLDSGDLFQGSLEGNISKGRATLEFYNLLLPDAVSIGNHEFDYGPDVSDRVSVLPGEDGMGTLKARVRDANFPMLSANLIVDPPVTCAPGARCNALGFQTVFEPRVVIQRAPGRVCVIGVTTPLTANITSPAFLRGTVFQELAPVVKAEAARFRERGRCDFVLLLAHEGLRYESDGSTLKNSGLMPVLEQLPSSTVDAVIGGHSHTPIQKVIQGTPVIQNGKSAQYVGVLYLSPTNGRKRHRFDPWVEVPDTSVAFDVTSHLMFYRREALEYKRQITGSTTAPFVYDKQNENALGNMVADSLRYADNVKADFSLINGGAIREDLPAGRISNDAVFRLMPFDDCLVVVDLNGKELRSLLEVACTGVLGRCATSGLRMELLDVPSEVPGPWDRDLNGDGKKEEWERNLVVKVRNEKGRALDDNRMYRLATISYLVEGGDYHDIVYDKIPGDRIRYYEDRQIRDLIGTYMQKHSPLNPDRFFSGSRPRVVTRPPG